MGVTMPKIRKYASCNVIPMGAYLTWLGLLLVLDPGGYKSGSYRIAFDWLAWTGDGPRAWGIIHLTAGLMIFFYRRIISVQYGLLTGSVWAAMLFLAWEPYGYAGSPSGWVAVSVIMFSTYCSIRKRRFFVE